MSEVTQILSQQIHGGDPRGTEQLLTLLYGDLRRLAAQLMASESTGHTLQPTALVHEAWIRLVGSGPQIWNSRGHFYAAAAEAMRRILIEAARHKATEKKGGRLRRIGLADCTVDAVTQQSD